MKTILSIFNIICFLTLTLTSAVPNVFAQQQLILPKPGVRVALSPDFKSPFLKGIKVNPNNPFQIDFIVDPGDSNESLSNNLDESNKLIKYFLTSVTTPQQDLWVNLSPYEHTRTIAENFGTTEMGRNLLAQDYLLKQITATLMYPNDELGKQFWKRIYETAALKYGRTDIPINTFNKVWIVPEKAVVYEGKKKQGSDASEEIVAYILESKLKVMLETDYLAQEKNSSVSLRAQAKQSFDSKIATSLLAPRDDAHVTTQGNPSTRHPASPNDTTAWQKQIIRDIILPEINKEVNEGKNFAPLRQIYQSLILGSWYKNKIKQSLLSQVYANTNKVAGLSFGNDDIGNTTSIYQQYLKAFKKGVFNLIQDEIDPNSQHVVARKYFSGGVEAIDLAMTIKTVDNFDQAQVSGKEVKVSVRIDPTQEDLNLLVEQMGKFESDYLASFSKPSVTNDYEQLLQLRNKISRQSKLWLSAVEDIKRSAQPQLVAIMNTYRQEIIRIHEANLHAIDMYVAHVMPASKKNEAIQRNALLGWQSEEKTGTNKELRLSKARFDTRKIASEDYMPAFRDLSSKLFASLENQIEIAKLEITRLFQASAYTQTILDVIRSRDDMLSQWFFKFNVASVSELEQKIRYFFSRYYPTRQEMEEKFDRLEWDLNQDELVQLAVAISTGTMTSSARATLWKLTKQKLNAPIRKMNRLNAIKRWAQVMLGVFIFSAGVSSDQKPTGQSIKPQTPEKEVVTKPGNTEKPNALVISTNLVQVSYPTNIGASSAQLMQTTNQLAIDAQKRIKELERQQQELRNQVSRNEEILNSVRNETVKEENNLRNRINKLPVDPSYDSGRFSNEKMFHPVKKREVNDKPVVSNEKEQVATPIDATPPEIQLNDSEVTQVDDSSSRSAAATPVAYVHGISDGLLVEGSFNLDPITGKLFRQKGDWINVNRLISDQKTAVYVIYPNIDQQENIIAVPFQHVPTAVETAKEGIKLLGVFYNKGTWVFRFDQAPGEVKIYYRSQRSDDLPALLPSQLMTSDNKPITDTHHQLLQLSIPSALVDFTAQISTWPMEDRMEAMKQYWNLGVIYYSTMPYLGKNFKLTQSLLKNYYEYMAGNCDGACASEIYNMRAAGITNGTIMTGFSIQGEKVVAADAHAALAADGILFNNPGQGRERSPSYQASKRGVRVSPEIIAAEERLVRARAARVRAQLPDLLKGILAGRAEREIKKKIAEEIERLQGQESSKAEQVRDQFGQLLYFNRTQLSKLNGKLIDHNGLMTVLAQVKAVDVKTAYTNDIERIAGLMYRLDLLDRIYDNYQRWLKVSKIPNEKKQQVLKEARQQINDIKGELSLEFDQLRNKTSGRGLLKSPIILQEFLPNLILSTNNYFNQNQQFSGVSPAIPQGIRIDAYRVPPSVFEVPTSSDNWLWDARDDNWVATVGGNTWDYVKGHIIFTHDRVGGQFFTSRDLRRIYAFPKVLGEGYLIHESFYGDDWLIARVASNKLAINTANAVSAEPVVEFFGPFADKYLSNEAQRNTFEDESTTLGEDIQNFGYFQSQGLGLLRLFNQKGVYFVGPLADKIGLSGQFFKAAGYPVKLDNGRVVILVRDAAGNYIFKGDGVPEDIAKRTFADIPQSNTWPLRLKAYSNGRWGKWVKNHQGEWELVGRDMLINGKSLIQSGKPGKSPDQASDGSLFVVVDYDETEIQGSFLQRPEVAKILNKHPNQKYKDLWFFGENRRYWVAQPDSGSPKYISNILPEGSNYATERMFVYEHPDDSSKWVATLGSSIIWPIDQAGKLQQNTMNVSYEPHFISPRQWVAMDKTKIVLGNFDNSNVQEFSYSGVEDIAPVHLLNGSTADMNQWITGGAVVKIVESDVDGTVKEIRETVVIGPIAEKRGWCIRDPGKPEGAYNAYLPLTRFKEFQVMNLPNGSILIQWLKDGENGIPHVEIIEQTPHWVEAVSVQHPMLTHAISASDIQATTQQLLKLLDNDFRGELLKQMLDQWVSQWLSSRKGIDNHVNRKDMERLIKTYGEHFFPLIDDDKRILCGKKLIQEGYLADFLELLIRMKAEYGIDLRIMNIMSMVRTSANDPESWMEEQWDRAYQEVFQREVVKLRLEASWANLASPDLPDNLMNVLIEEGLIPVTFKQLIEKQRQLKQLRNDAYMRNGNTTSPQGLISKIQEDLGGFPFFGNQRGVADELELLYRLVRYRGFKRVVDHSLEELRHRRPIITRISSPGERARVEQWQRINEEIFKSRLSSSTGPTDIQIMNEISRNGMLWMTMVGVISFILTSKVNKLRQRDQVQGTTAAGTFDTMWENLRRDDRSFREVDDVYQLKNIIKNIVLSTESLTVQEKNQIRTWRDQLSDRGKLLADFILAIPGEYPADGLLTLRQRFSYLIPGAFVFNGTADSVKQRRAMLKEMQELSVDPNFDFAKFLGLLERYRSRSLKEAANNQQVVSFDAITEAVSRQERLKIKEQGRPKGQRVIVSSGDFDSMRELSPGEVADSRYVRHVNGRNVVITNTQQKVKSSLFINLTNITGDNIGVFAKQLVSTVRAFNPKNRDKSDEELGAYLLKKVLCVLPTKVVSIEIPAQVKGEQVLPYVMSRLEVIYEQALVEGGLGSALSVAEGGAQFYNEAPLQQGRYRERLKHGFASNTEAARGGASLSSLKKFASILSGQQVYGVGFSRDGLEVMRRALSRSQVGYYNPDNNVLVHADPAMNVQETLKPAINSVNTTETGGIDLTSEKVLEVQGDTTGQIDVTNIRGIADQALLSQLAKAPGFIPVIIHVEPIVNMRSFLGVTD